MTREPPKTAEELDVLNLLGLDNPGARYDVGDELWVPVSPIRGDGDRFRTMKIEITDMATVGGYETYHALHNMERWESYKVREDDE